jgi:hypothetical protein
MEPWSNLERGTMTVLAAVICCCIYVDCLVDIYKTGEQGFKREQYKLMFASYPVVATSLDQVEPPVAEAVPLGYLLHVPQSLTAQKQIFNFYIHNFAISISRTFSYLIHIYLTLRSILCGVSYDPSVSIAT